MGRWVELTWQMISSRTSFSLVSPSQNQHGVMCLSYSRDDFSLISSSIRSGGSGELGTEVDVEGDGV